MYNPQLDYAYTQIDINPCKHRIHVDYIRLKHDYPITYDKQLLSIVAHEIQHLIDWYTYCHKDVNVWNTDDTLENRANVLQDKVLSIYKKG